MDSLNHLTRRQFIGAAAAVPAASAALASGADAAQQEPAPEPIPLGTIGKVKISRMLLGGNLIGGWMHSRDLQYVGRLFRAYVTEQKIMETIALAEKHGINTVFETGGDFVLRHNKENRGKMQFIPHIEVTAGQSEQALKDHIKAQAESGACALYVWGVSSDTLMMNGQAGKLARAVELAKVHGLPIGVGSHSLLVPKEMEKLGAPVDFYVKTLHKDDYPSATPKEKRKEFMWVTGENGYYDNMWCINPEETVQFMKSVAKPWIAFKILAAGAYHPRDAFKYAFSSGADFVAVGMFDFQIRENCEILSRTVRDTKVRDREWRG